MLAAPGCTDTTYDLRVRDPGRVAVARRGETLVPEGATFSPRVVIERYGERYRAERTGDGTLRLEVPSSWALQPPYWETLVDREGRVTSLPQGPAPEPATTWWAGEEVRAPLCHSGGRVRCSVPLSLVTPQGNVRELTRVVTPRRSLVPILAVTSAAFGAVGVASTVLWSKDRAPTTGGWVPGTLSLTASAASLAAGAWFLFGPARREALIAPAP